MFSALASLENLGWPVGAMNRGTDLFQRHDKCGFLIQIPAKHETEFFPPGSMK